MDRYLKRTIGKIVFRTLIASSIVGMLIMPIYYSTISFAKNQVVKDTQGLLENNSSNLRQMLDYYNRLAVTIGENRDIQYLMRKPNSNFSYDINELISASQFVSHTAVYSLVEIYDLCISFENSPYIITKTNIFEDRNKYYGQYISYSQVPAGEWFEKLRNNRGIWDSKTILNRDSKMLNSITLVYNLGFSEGVKPLGTVAFIVPETVFTESMLTDQIKENGFLRIFNKQGLQITAYGEIPEFDDGFCSNSIPVTKEGIDNAKYMVFSGTIVESELYYEAGISYDVFYDSAKPVSRLLNFYLLLALTLCGAVFAFYSFKNYNPLRSLIKDIGNMNLYDENIGDEYSYLRGVIANISKTNQKISAEHTNISALFESSLMDKIYHNMVFNESESLLLRKYLSAISSPYITIILSIPTGLSEEEQHLFYATCQKLTKSFLGSETYIHNFYSNVVIFCSITHSPSDYKLHTEKALLQFNNVLYEFFSQAMLIGVSSLYYNISDISAAFNEALNCLYISEIFDGKSILFYEQVDKERHFTALNTKILQKLQDVLLSADTIAAIKIFGEIAQILLNNNVASETYKASIFYSIQNVFLNVQSLVSNEDSFVNLPDYTKEEQLGVLLNRQIETAISFCECINTQRKSNNISLKTNIIDFINENYTNTDLCLTMIANEFEVSEHYISVFIKEQTGKNYTEHVEDLRLQKSVELLMQDVPINQIALKVGFVSHNTFYKSFKKRFAIAPSKYKNI